jgi:prepilin-type N-terminal cleavage/methylation domain-containing protein
MTNRESKMLSARVMTRRRRLSRKRCTSRRDGFTLIELVVAIMILVVGVLGLAGTAGAVSRMVGGAAQQTIAANVAASRFETLRSLPCSQVVANTATTRNMAEKWTVTTDAGSSNLTVTDSITYNAAGGRTRQLAFQSLIRCQ